MKKVVDKLVLIPARIGSKGVKEKNIKLLNGRPLVFYTLDVAKKIGNAQICVSTDSGKIKSVVTDYGINVPFLRPPELAKDSTPTYDVILYTLGFYSQKDIMFNKVILLQPTSPFRTITDVDKALKMYDESIDMVVSVKETKANPYYNLFEENEDGFLVKSKPGVFTRRQECPKVYEYNGAIYVMNSRSLLTKKLDHFTKNRKYVMSEESSFDIDSEFDFTISELLLKHKL